MVEQFNYLMEHHEGGCDKADCHDCARFNKVRAALLDDVFKSRQYRMRSARSMVLALMMLCPFGGAARCEELTPAEVWQNVLFEHSSQDWLSWWQKMPVDAALPDLQTALRPVNSDDTVAQEAAPLPVHLANWQPTAPSVGPYQFTARFNAITTISLGRRKNAALVNVRACNIDPTRGILLPQEQLLTGTNLNMLTATQATWLLTQKRGKQWSVMLERYGTLGLALGAAFASQPYVAAAIPLVQQVIDFFKGQEPDIAPFLQEMLPLELPLSAAGQKGDCVTGTMFAAKKGNVL